MNAKEKEYTDEEYMEFLDEIYGEVEICGMKYSSGQALQEIDPTAFRVGKSDMDIRWICDECDAEYETEDEANECCKPDEDEETNEVQP